MAEGSAEDFNLTSVGDITFGPLHRVHVIAGDPESPEISPQDEWVVALYQAGAPRGRITLYVDERGRYAFGEAAASTAMGYLASMDQMARSEILVYVPISNDFYAVNSHSEAVCGLSKSEAGHPESIQALAEAVQELHREGDTDLEAGFSVEGALGPWAQCCWSWLGRWVSAW